MNNRRVLIITVKDQQITGSDNFLKDYQVNNYQKDCIRFIDLPKEGNTKESFNEFLTKVKNNITNEKQINYIALIHSSTQVGDSENTISKDESLRKKIEETLDILVGYFEGGDKRINKLLNDFHRIEPDALENEKIKDNVFNDIWNAYIRESPQKKYYDSLKKFIPVLIDFHGLNDCSKNEDAFMNYLKEVKKGKRWDNLEPSEYDENLNMFISKCKSLESIKNVKEFETCFINGENNVFNEFRKLRNITG